ncbi:MAG: substrate-binding domain-containing protein, partial [Bacteroidales bacterium]|nr:substrate-binding domain-containing protein [Bacteroidales bacterium]
IRDTSFRIPEDISLIAFDNHVSLDYMTPPMTRVSQPVEEMGKLASKLLFDYIENKTDSITQLELATTIISKSSIVPVVEG